MYHRYNTIKQLSNDNQLGKYLHSNEADSRFCQVLWESEVAVSILINKIARRLHTVDRSPNLSFC